MGLREIIRRFVKFAGCALVPDVVESIVLLELAVNFLLQLMGQVFESLFVSLLHVLGGQGPLLFAVSGLSSIPLHRLFSVVVDLLLVALFPDVVLVEPIDTSELSKVLSWVDNVVG